MNKLDVSNLGGQPTTLDDVNFLQNALSEAISGLSVMINQYGPPVIIAGLGNAVIGSDTFFYPGWVSIGQEIYYVNGGTFPTVTMFAINVGGDSYDSNGVKTFEDLSVHQTYIVRQGNIEPYTSAPNQIPIYQFVSFAKALQYQGVVIKEEVSWTNVSTFSSGWGNGSGTFSGNVSRYRVNSIGRVELEGEVRNLSVSGVASTIFTLPVGLRPTQNKRFITIGRKNITDYFMFQIVVFSNGVVNVYGQSIGDDIQFSLENIGFSIN